MTHTVVGEAPPVVTDDDTRSTHKVIRSGTRSQYAALDVISACIIPRYVTLYATNAKPTLSIYRVLLLLG